jgi:hypothetical protein
MSIKLILMKRDVFIKMRPAILFLPAFSFLFFFNAATGTETPLRTMKYTSRPESEAKIWQSNLRAKLFTVLRMDDLCAIQNSIELSPKEIRSEDKGEYLLKEIEINSTRDRRIRVIITIPKKTKGPWPAVVSIHGHGGQLLSVYDKSSIYKGFASELAARNYVTIATVVSQHEIYEKDRMLMGERLWDLMRCVDYLESLPGVDKNRIGCAGLSLGGEMAMWLGAMDVRIHATVSSGFLTNMDHMEKNHCMCWKFPGLRELVDYADIYSLMAPWPLQCQNGLKEPLNDFTVPLANEALKEIKVIYTDFGQPENVSVDAHEGAHEIDLPSLLSFFDKYLGSK